MQLLKQKCLPVLLYALQVCNLGKKTMNSLDFTLNWFKTFDMEIVKYCHSSFGCELLSVLLKSDMTDLLEQWHDLDKILFVLFV